MGDSHIIRRPRARVLVASFFLVALVAAACGSGEEVPGFQREGAAMLRFAARYAPPEIAAVIRAGGYSLDAFGFDWTLDEAPRP